MMVAAVHTDHHFYGFELAHASDKTFVGGEFNKLVGHRALSCCLLPRSRLASDSLLRWAGLHGIWPASAATTSKDEMPSSPEIVCVASGWRHEIGRASCRER